MRAPSHPSRDVAPSKRSSHAPRLILHLDMDAFFASVEIVRRPELRGRPVVVGGDGPRGVVAAASYEARAYGVFSAMSSVRARRLCPHAVFLHGDHAHYAQVSRRIMAILSQVTPLVEPLSLDEAFCDLTGSQTARSNVVAVAEGLRRQIREAEGLESAVGVGPSKFVAKLASKRAKPRVGRPGEGPGPGVGVLVVEAERQRDFLDPLPVSEIWGVGPATLRRLEAMGIATIADLTRVPESALQTSLGLAAGSQLHGLAHGIDPREVVSNRTPKSVGHEETYVHDLTDRTRIDVEIRRLADATASRLREHGLLGRTVVLKVRFADFTTITRSRTLTDPTASGRTIAAVASALMDTVGAGQGVRLLGVTASGLSPVDAALQLSFDVSGQGQWSTTERVVDEVRARFGSDAIAPATLLSKGELQVRRRGDQQWGKKSEQGPDDQPEGRDRPR